MTTDQLNIIVPVLSPRDNSNSIDEVHLREYVSRAASSWIDRFLIFGSTDQGWTLTSTARTALLDVWLDAVPPTRLVACCWTDADEFTALARGVQVLATEAGHPSARLIDLPQSAMAYSHPTHSPLSVTPSAIRDARAVRPLIRGAKLSKVSTDELAAVREAAGQDFILWDGSSRHLAESYQAGAAGAVCAPLAPLVHPFSTRPPLDELQVHLDHVQAIIAARGPDRSTALRALAFPGS